MKRRDVLKTLGISAAILGTGLFSACVTEDEVKNTGDLAKTDSLPPPPPKKELSEREKMIVNRDVMSFKDPENPTKAELKHTPEIKIEAPDSNGFSEIKVIVGQQGVIHPTTNAHWIDYISLWADDKKVGHVEFEAGTASGYASFKIKREGVKVITAEAGCNIHGIWKSKV